MDLVFASGVIASVAVSWFAPRKIRNVMLVGDASMLVYDDTDAEEPVKVHDRGVIVEDSADFGMHQLTYRYGDTVAPHIAVREPLTVQLAHFLDAIERGVRPISDGRFGLGVVAALEAADESWRNGGIPTMVTDPTGSFVG
jgi:predicted dehydrogenase